MCNARKSWSGLVGDTLSKIVTQLIIFERYAQWYHFYSSWLLISKVKLKILKIVKNRFENNGS